jgi:hypothetical protein
MKPMAKIPLAFENVFCVRHIIIDMSSRMG